MLLLPLPTFHNHISAISVVYCDFHKYHTNFKKTTYAETHDHANIHIFFF